MADVQRLAPFFLELGRRSSPQSPNRKAVVASFAVAAPLSAVAPWRLIACARRQAPTSLDTILEEGQYADFAENDSPCVSRGSDGREKTASS